MIKNYFKTAWRNLWKNKSTSFINLFGLSIGMTAAVFIFLWVQNELTADSSQPARNNIFRITNSIQVSSAEAWVWETSPLPMADAAVKEIPEVEKSTKLRINAWAGSNVNVNHKLFQEKTSAYVDKAWFNIFHYDFLSGNAVAFNNNPNGLVLSEAKAKKYFGNLPAVGQIIRIDTMNYTVEGVIADNPVNSSFQFDIIIQMEGYLSAPAVYKNEKNWNNFGYITFLQLRADANKSLVETKLNEIINKNRTNHTDKVSMQPFASMYFENDLQSSDMPHGNKKTTYIFTLLGLLLLIIACINYVNLTTARASLRAKEVSVRKIIGAQKRHLFFQFVAESLTISIIALLLSLLLIKLLLPAFNATTEKQFVLPLLSLPMWRVLLGTLFFATVLNSIYPAALLSSFKPMNVFRGKSVLKIRDVSIRKGLVVFQFALSIILIMGAIVIYRQLNFIQTTNPGYNVSQIMSVPVPWKVYAQLKPEAQQQLFTSMGNEFKSQAGIESVCTGGDEIVNVGNASSGNADWDGRDTAFNPTIAGMSADADFQKMFRVQLKTGRWFKPGDEDKHNYILNETAEASFNLHKPILGQRFTLGGDTGRIVGIVKDFHYKSMHEKIGPLVMQYNNGSDSYFFIKNSPGNVQKAISSAETVWAKFIPTEPFNYSFLDDSFNKLYKNDIKTSTLIFIFSVIAIIISALGLFGLATFTAAQRTKEIGIRKVLGASVNQIAALLSKDFIRLVLIAVVIAVPIAWWEMHKWLQNFAYRINISAAIVIASGSIALLIALISVGMQAIKAAIANPVKSLRTD